MFQNTVIKTCNNITLPPISLPKDFKLETNINTNNNNNNNNNNMNTDVN